MCSINVHLGLLKADVEFLLWGGVCKVIFISNPTTVLRLCCWLCCGVIGVVTINGMVKFYVTCSPNEAGYLYLRHPENQTKMCSFLSSFLHIIIDRDMEAPETTFELRCNLGSVPHTQITLFSFNFVS